MATVHVWHFPTRLPEHAVAAHAALLDRAERERAAAIRSLPRRQDYLAVRAVVRAIVGHHLATDPAALRWRRGPHGKPELAGRWDGVRVNLTHSGGQAALAITDQCPVGVDLEQERAVDAAAMAARFFPRREAALVARGADPTRQRRRFFRLWVRKEACVKAAGARLLPGLLLPVAGPGPWVLAHAPAAPLPGPFVVCDLPAPPGFHAAVALAAASRFQVVRHWWDPVTSCPSTDPSSPERRHPDSAGRA